MIPNFAGHPVFLRFKKKVIEKGYKSDLLDKYTSTLEKLDRNEMLMIIGPRKCLLLSFC